MLKYAAIVDELAASSGYVFMLSLRNYNRKCQSTKRNVTLFDHELVTIEPDQSKVYIVSAQSLKICYQTASQNRLKT